jgi:hypothetical protein
MKNEKFFLFTKNYDSSDKYRRSQNESDNEVLFRRERGVINRIPETLDKVVKGIPKKKSTIILRKYIQRINDRGCKKESLKYYGHDVLDISHHNVCRGCDQRQPQGEEKMKADDDRDEEQTPGNRDMEKYHKSQKKKCHDDMVDKPRQNIRKREHDLRNVHLPDQGLIVHDRSGCHHNRLLYHHPGSEACKKEDRVVVDLKPYDLRKNQRQNKKIKQWIQYRPQES